MQGLVRNAVLYVALVLGSGAATAATMPAVTASAYDRPAFDAHVSGLHNAVVEDFESFAMGEVFGGLATAVGVFDTLGATGSGGTVKGTAGNTGNGVFLRDRNVYGRSNTTAGGDSYLDSNDTYGLSWTIAGLGMFDRLFFTVSDIADSGASFTILADGQQVGSTISRQRNGAVDMVMLSFGTAVDTLTLHLRHSKLNDGFSIDDAGIGLSRGAAQTPSSVPLPPAVALLAGGIAALALFRRRRA
ncbi:VPLPA-CTERM sorting domain-containing protein [Meridianimarinicoccus sp. RP-17]|uniref:VPLPA-CTERM sorting domain-containing protein n=1 Tax=Meridianimarinicoccus zhengii TaxID=2056810 RepID=UPI000DAC4494|nr:VPLPA-CTERM sorting domain-containing protein [Phycocomes zhengii]